MVNTYPIRFPAQLRQHLRSLRKKHGLTQANVAALLGVSQARVAEIEANPGLVSFEQIMQLLATLGATVTLLETDLSPLFHEAKHVAQSGTTSDSQARTGVPGTLAPDESLDQAGTASDESSSSNSVRKVTKNYDAPTPPNLAQVGKSGSELARRTPAPLGELDHASKTVNPSSDKQARKAIDASSSLYAARKAVDSLGGLDSARKALDAISASETARKALDSLGGLDQARKAIEASSGLDAARKAIDSLGGLDQARKTLRDLESLQSYRNALVHSKKGNW
jgi:transcriptional regulator with XRE-family HTH domain